MKKISLLFILFASTFCHAQYKYYKDSTYTSPFNLLSGATSANNGQWWDENSYVVPLGFNFWLFHDSVTQVSIYEGNKITSSPNPDSADFITGIIPTYSDLVDRDTSGLGSFSPISYITTGTAPNRICKIEWKNAGFFNAIGDGELSDSINMQTWLYETSNIIEIRIGNSNFFSPNQLLYDDGPGYMCGLFDSLDLNSPILACRVLYFLKGNPATPDIDSTGDFNFFTPPGMTGSPSAGRVYRFVPQTPPAINVGYTTYQEKVNYNIDFYAAQNELKIDIFNDEEFAFIITDMSGQIISKGKATRGRKIIQTSAFASGMYLLKMYSKSEQASYKFVK